MPRLALVRLVATLVASAAAGVATSPLILHAGTPQGRGAPPQTGAPPPPGRAGQASSQLPAPKGTGLIVGKVVDANGKDGVAGAVVTLNGNGIVLLNGQSFQLGPGVQQGPGNQAGAAMGPKRVMTDGQGRFAFRDLPKGTYSFNVVAAGYTGGAYGQKRVGGPTRPLELDDAQKLANVTLLVWKYGAISGIVSDEAGEPAVGVHVRALRQTIVGAKRRLVPFGTTATTDDRGMYRIGTLVPGDYLVVIPSSVTTMPNATVDLYNKAMSEPPPQPARGGPPPQPPGMAIMNEFNSSFAPMPNGGGVKVGDFQIQPSNPAGRALTGPAPTDDGKVFIYQTMFYPGVTTSAQAAAITLTSGEEHADADIQLRIVQSARVSGTVSGPDGPMPNFGLRLLPIGVEEMATDSGFESATTVTDPMGGFTFLGVPTGSYVIKALKVPRSEGPRMAMMASPVGMTPANATQVIEPTLWANVPVAVAGPDVTGVSVLLRAGLRVSGRIEFEGSATRPTADAMQRAMVNLSSLDSRTAVPSSSPARVTADGQFTTMGYPPGKYGVEVNGPFPGWTFKSASLGGRDLSITALDLSETDMGGLVLTFTDRPTEISGSVRAAVGATGELDAMVLIFPSAYQMWVDNGTNGRVARTVSVPASGAFKVTGLPPGDYFVAAISRDSLSDVRDAKFYETVARGATRVTLADGDKHPVDLTVGQIR